jgi:hypothetical protein
VKTWGEKEELEVFDCMAFADNYLDRVVFIGSDEGYGLRKPDAAEYIDGVCQDAAVISGLSIG